MRAPWFVAFLAWFTACSSQEFWVEGHGDGDVGVVALEGADLADELRDSPVRFADEEFVRLGVLWDADRAEAIEVATSSDGETWSPFAPPTVRHVELEEQGSFVGVVEAVSEARFFRLRSGEGEATYARLELLPLTLAESVEDRTDLPVAYMTIGVANVHGRAEWGARSAGCASAMGTPWRMAIHHTETPTEDTISPEARLRAIQSYHMDVRGWCDVAYHYLMSRDGRLWEGRPAQKLGAHAGSGNNSGNLGISVMGSHGSTPITDTQLSAVAGLVRGLADLDDIPINRTKIKGHREYKSTSCPGDALFAQLGDIVDAATGAGAVGGGGTAGGSTVTVKGVLYEGSDTSERIAGATVRLGTRSATTSATGYWEFTGVPEGTFTVSAEAAGYVTVSITRASYAAATWASFGLSPVAATTGTSVLQGVVYHSTDSSNRIPYATVTLSTGHTATAGASGFYQITGLPAGVVTISADATGYAASSVARTLVEGETAWGSVRLDP
ncbi:MAG: N-acetylmuramoyl-L-alanine amidase [Myxococcota bacterium]